MTHDQRGLGRVRFRTPAARVVGGAFALLLALAPQTQALAQARPQPETAVSPAPAPRPALWVVRDADSTLYLFGTVHFLRPTTEWETPRVAAAFDSADVLVLEVADPNDQSPVMPLIQRYGISPDRPLSSLLDADDLARLDAAARTVGASAAQMDGLRPWLAGVALSASALTRAGYAPGSGVDMVLRARAVEAGKPVDGFETPEDQIRMLSGFPEAGQLTFLRRTLDDFDDALVVPDRVVAAWAAGDIATIDAIAVEPMRRDSETVYRAVLVDRNTRWADRIETLLEGSGTAFIAVGVMHLTGDDSVQAILRARGVEVSDAP